MSTPIEATVAGVVAGRYPEDTVVTISGQVNNPTWKTSVQGNPWATFTLSDWPTSVLVQLPPEQYREFGAGMGPTLADYRPQRLTITGRVINGWRQSQPEVIVTDVRRHTDEPCESLEKLRRMGLRARERFADGPLPPRGPEPGEGIGRDEVIAQLRGPAGTETPS